MCVCVCDVHPIPPLSIKKKKKEFLIENRLTTPLASPLPPAGSEDKKEKKGAVPGVKKSPPLPEGKRKKRG